MLRYAMYVTVNIVFIQLIVVTLIWPPKELRNRLVARARKRLCTTVIHHSQQEIWCFGDFALNLDLFSYT